MRKKKTPIDAFEEYGKEEDEIFELAVSLRDEEELMAAYEYLQEKGYEVRVLPYEETRR